MKLLFLDFETFYSDEYSLKKMTPPQYILDPRYEIIGCSAAVDDETPHWVDGPDFQAYIDQFDPADTQTVTFNALFDNCILAWKHGFVPSRIYCSMRLAAALRGHLLHRVSLSNVAKVLGLGEKGSTILNVKGMRRTEIMNDPGLWRAFQAYSNNDNELSRRVFMSLIGEYPQSQRKIMDHVLRCAIEPGFVVDTKLLSDHLADLELDRMETLLEAANDAPEAERFAAVRRLRDEPGTPGEGAAAADALRRLVERNTAKVEEIASSLRSNAKFEEVLKARGIDVAYKPSATNPEVMIPAFAKTDEFMADLQEHDDPLVQALAGARLGLRSTIERSRGEKILAIASLPWAACRYRGGNMPIPLRISGAHTHRLSGEWKINMQNLPAGRDKLRPSKLRKSLKAPRGYKVLVADLSQIECRIAAWLCGETDLIDQFASKKDPYSILGSKIFGFVVDKKVHLLERFIGKSGVLGLGFGCGADKFYNMVLRSARAMHMDMAKLLAVWSPALAQKSVDTYRQANQNIKRSWANLQGLLDTAWCGASGPVRWGPGGVVEIGEGYVLLPNGMKLRYVPGRDANGECCYRYGKKSHRMYGPKFLENIVQALAFIVVMNAALRLWDRGLKFKLQAHDELAFIVPEAEAESAKAIVLDEMRRRPSWAPDLPLDAEANYGDSYGDAK